MFGYYIEISKMAAQTITDDMEYIRKQTLANAERYITPELKGRFNTVSISLNAPNAEEYLSLTRSKFGLQSYEAIKDFAVKAKKYVPNVVFTVVEKVMSEEKIKLCQKICDDLGVKLRVRPFES